MGRKANGEESMCFLPSISLWENMLQYEFCLFGVKSIVLYYKSTIWDLRAYSEGVDSRYWVSIHYLNMLWFSEQLVPQIGYLLQRSVLKDVFTVYCLLFIHFFWSAWRRYHNWLSRNKLPTPFYRVVVNLYWCEQGVNYLMCEYWLGI